MQGDKTKQPDATEGDATEEVVQEDGERVVDAVEVVVEDDQSDQSDQPEQAEQAEQAEPEQQREAEPLESAIARAVSALQEKAKSNHDNYVRAVADGDNFRKRSKRDIKAATERAEDKVVRSFLPVIDNLERALAHAEADEDKDVKGLVDGVRMVQKQFGQTLERFGITAFESVGQPFDPELHEAIQQMPSDYPANTVAMELHRGYKRENRLVRPAMVAVSLGQPEQERPAEPEQDHVPDGADDGKIANDESKEE